jgi:hypothetical protein
LTENGFYKEALQTLDVALSDLQTTVLLNNNYDDGIEELAFVPYSAVLYESNHSSQSLRIEDDAEMDHGDFIYRSPIRTNGNEEEGDGLDLSVIIIFNMALANHLRARQGKHVRSHQRLRKALKLYELCFFMQRREGGSGELNMTQVLALVNNCGQIYKKLNRERKARKFFQYMLSTIMTMVEVGSAQDVEQMDGFLVQGSPVLFCGALAQGRAVRTSLVLKVTR